ncbi:heparinase II/III family protein [Uliginosibacterium paludis]|uniref:Heparinase II/III family protein n=1 Tax=Uliginosibacterium paludis TaxID=1615952 RepID=A0ABV2CR75_9RHOO
MRLPRPATLAIATLATFCLLAACSSLTPQAQGPAAPHSDEAGLPAHPRLIALDADWQALALRRSQDADLDRLVVQLLARARKDLALPPLKRQLEGKRLLGVSREFIRRSLLWSFAYRITLEPQFADRARREMLNVAAFSDWNPAHYLDVAEMTAGLALSYDWLFQALPPQDRATLRRAIVDKGIAQARHGHKTFTLTNNWGQVCIGGMVLGALAVAEDEPALARDLLAAARKDAFIALDAYRPDGVYPEGPGYWSYGTAYEMLLIAALRSSLGADWGLMDAPGLKQSANFMAQSLGPSGKSFNFADGGEGAELAPPLFLLARELQSPDLIAARREMIRKGQGLSDRFAPLAALWWPAPGSTQPAALHFSGQGPQPVAIWRSAWNDPDALYFAIKGGGAGHNHAHMDAGAFVLDLDGVRWAKDLGMQDYNSLESRGIDLWNMKQGSPRWRVFRLGSDAHNTLTLDGTLHDAQGMATLEMAGQDEARIDLTPVFLPGQLRRATRSARVEGRRVQLTDQLSGARPGSTIRWAMMTDADITLAGSEALLRKGGKTLHLRFAGSPVELEVLDASMPRAEWDSPNPGNRQLVARGRADASGQWQLSVRFSSD